VLLGGELSIFSPLYDDGAGDRVVNSDDGRLSLTTQLLLQSSQQVQNHSHCR